METLIVGAAVLGSAGVALCLQKLVLQILFRALFRG
jgi:hypothetical protein